VSKASKKQAAKRIIMSALTRDKNEFFLENINSPLLRPLLDSLRAFLRQFRIEMGREDMNFGFINVPPYPA